MNKIIPIIIASIFAINSIYAYIDPGSGAYILSSIWSVIVGFFALILGVILRFFRHTLKNFISNFWKNHRILFIISTIILISSLTYTINYFFISESEFILPKYDESLNGAHILKEKEIYPGYNLYNGKLLDNKGNLIKTWNYSYLSILDEKGNYYAQKGYETLEWGKFTWNDEPIWIKELPIHHEIYLTPNNTIITFSKDTHTYNERLVEFDTILEFDTDGNLLQKYSTYDHLKELQKFHRQLELDKPPSVIIPEDHRKNTSIWGANHDYYHLNSFSLVPPNYMEGFHPAFNPGNWIISFRHGSMLFILDKNTKEVLWTAIFDQVENNLEGQHIPKMLENGNIMIFDNGRYREWSRILILNPVDLSVVSEYKHNDFFSYSQGYYQELPNGNMLITESEKGKVFEINKNKEIVWKYYEPKYTENEKYGTIREELYRMTRYDKGLIDNIIINN